MLWTKWILLFACCITGIYKIAAQPEDSSYIRKFDKQNNVELFNSYNSNRLQFYTAEHHNQAVNLFTNNGLFTGVYLNYKWVTIGYGMDVPFTNRDNNVKDFKLYRFNLNTYKHGWGVTGNANIYKGFLSQQYKDQYTPVPGVRYTNLNADLYHVGNYRQFSFNAAHWLSEQQMKSCGTFIYHFRPSYAALKAESHNLPENYGEPQFISENPRWLSLTGSLSYAYSFVWNNGKWIISPRIEAGGGILYQFGIEEKLKPTGFGLTAITTGYNSNVWYIYLSAETNNTKSIFSSTIMREDQWSVSLTAGYRLGDLKRKILGLL
jgi:hypothetical protein